MWNAKKKRKEDGQDKRRLKAAFDLLIYKNHDRVSIRERQLTSDVQRRHQTLGAVNQRPNINGALIGTKCDS